MVPTFCRKVTVRHEKKGWGVLDVGGPTEFKSMFKRSGSDASIDHLRRRTPAQIAGNDPDARAVLATIDVQQCRHSVRLTTSARVTFPPSVAKKFRPRVFFSSSFPLEMPEFRLFCRFLKPLVRDVLLRDLEQCDSHPVC